MNFLEAKRLLDGFAGGPALDFVFGLSGSAEPFDLYLRAAAARHGFAAKPVLLPFNTLAQRLRGPRTSAVPEVLLLMPWDFAPEADWRSGIPERAEYEMLRQSAIEIANLLSQRDARLLYLPAPIPPLFRTSDENSGFARMIEGLATALGAKLLPANWFSLAGYFASGCPVGGGSIGSVATLAIELLVQSPAQPKKVLVTDLDNVVWKGGIAEDGLDGISYAQHGSGFPHFVYQRLLRRLRSQGTLLAAVSRNDAETALSPFTAPEMTLREDDFVAIVASYNAKSAQITELASRLNLGLDAFVFVDDNPIELTEVSLALPAVRCLQFPATVDALPAFLSDLAMLFDRRTVTSEDRERTELYRRRLVGIAPSSLSGADVTRFLRDLEMTLTLHDHSRGEHERAIQLINKTNQFNLNGRRITEQELSAILHAGGRLYGATLTDRSGSHGEILSCLITADGVISSFVMSCRVFQRRVEHAFMAWLVGQANPTSLTWMKTPRNEPFAQFLRELSGGIEPPDGAVPISAAQVSERFSKDLDLFSIVGTDAVAV